MKHRGFQVAGHIRYFVAPASVPIPEPKWLAGFRVRQFKDVQSLETLAAVQNRCYHDMRHHIENTEGAITEAVLAEYMPQHPDYFDPAGIHLVFSPEAEPIGICYGRVGSEQEGQRQKIIDSPGIAPQYRELNLQRPLTLRVMRWLRQNYNDGPIELHTFGDYERAVEIYAALGFRLEPEKHYVDFCQYLS